METIKDGKDYLKQNWDKGVSCPCCNQFVKRYKRLFDSGLARFLIALYKLTDGDTNLAINKDDVRALAGLKKLQATNYGIIEFWDLAVPVKNDDPKKRTSGLWKITGKGVGFVRYGNYIPKYMFTYNNRCYGVSDELTTVRKALGSHFNYEELMKDTHEL